MTSHLRTEVRQAISTEQQLQDCYRRMLQQPASPKARAVLRDMLLMEEMNEVLLRSLSQTLSV